MRIYLQLDIKDVLRKCLIKIRNLKLVYIKLFI